MPIGTSLPLSPEARISIIDELFAIGYISRVEARKLLEIDYDIEKDSLLLQGLNRARESTSPFSKWEKDNIRKTE